MTTGSAHHLRCQALFIFAQHCEDGRHSADPAADLGKRFSGGACATAVEVLNPTLEDNPVEGVKVDHQTRAPVGAACSGGYGGGVPPRNTPTIT
jgi:hypothetical protein